MMNKFVVGKTYDAYQKEYGRITILKRTDKTIWVRNDPGLEWRMRVKVDGYGDEYAVDSVVPKKWQDAFTYSASDESEM